MSVTSYYVRKNGDHVEAGTGRLLSTRESRANEDIPLWKRFEIERLEDVDGHIVPGRNALEKDIEEYGKNITKTKLHKTRGQEYVDLRSNPEGNVRPKTEEFIEVGNVNSYGDVEVNITYPEGYDELVGRAWISDDSTVSMRCQESAGNRHRETVTNADFLTFMLPQGYGLEEATEVKLHFYFRKENTQMKKSAPYDFVRSKNVRKVETRKMDWEVRTPWEKKLKVDFPMKNHRRWSTWTDQERDIYAYVIYRIQELSEEFGPKGKQTQDFTTAHADVLIDFGRDHKPMPQKYITEHVPPKGISENTEVVWEQPKIDGLGKWVAKETAAGSENSEMEAVNRYRNAVGMPPVEPSQNDKLRAALVNVNMRPDVVVKEFNPETKQLEEIEGKLQAQVRTSTTKIMPNDDRFTALEKALNWAVETQHGPDHQERWSRIAAALGADNGFTPMSMNEVKKWWNHFGQNARWTMAMNALGAQEEVEAREKEMERYNSKLSMQGSFTAEEWKQRTNEEPIICKFEGYDDLTIYDHGAGRGMPNWWLEGPGEPTQLWRLEENGNFTYINELVTSEERAESDANAKLLADGPESWVVNSPEELPNWYWALEAWPMDTTSLWGKVQVAPGHFVFYDGTGPRGRWSADLEAPATKDPSMDTVTVPVDMAEAIRDGDWDRVAALARMQT